MGNLIILNHDSKLDLTSKKEYTSPSNIHIDITSITYITCILCNSTLSVANSYHRCKMRQFLN